VIHWAKGYKFVRENYGQKGQKFIGKKGRLSVRKNILLGRLAIRQEEKLEGPM
jgi:hypothetical protein